VKSSVHCVRALPRSGWIDDARHPWPSWRSTAESVSHAAGASADMTPFTDADMSRCLCGACSRRQRRAFRYNSTVQCPCSSCNTLSNVRSSCPTSRFVRLPPMRTEMTTQGVLARFQYFEVTSRPARTRADRLVRKYGAIRMASGSVQRAYGSLHQ